MAGLDGTAALAAAVFAGAFVGACWGGDAGASPGRGAAWGAAAATFLVGADADACSGEAGVLGFSFGA